MAEHDLVIAQKNKRQRNIRVHNEQSFPKLVFTCHACVILSYRNRKSS